MSAAVASSPLKMTTSPNSSPMPHLPDETECGSTSDLENLATSPAGTRRSVDSEELVLDMSGFNDHDTTMPTTPGSSSSLTCKTPLQEPLKVNQGPRFNSSSDRWTMVKVRVSFDITRKGERSLVIDGYKFTKSRDGMADRVFWRCSRRECKATAVTVTDHVEHIRAFHEHSPPVASEFFSGDQTNVGDLQEVRFNNYIGSNNGSSGGRTRHRRRSTMEIAEDKALAAAATSPSVLKQQQQPIAQPHSLQSDQQSTPRTVRMSGSFRTPTPLERPNLDDGESEESPQNDCHKHNVPSHTIPSVPASYASAAMDNSTAAQLTAHQQALVTSLTRSIAEQSNQRHTMLPSGLMVPSNFLQQSTMNLYPLKLEVSRSLTPSRSPSSAVTAPFIPNAGIPSTAQYPVLPAEAHFSTSSTTPIYNPGLSSNSYVSPHHQPYAQQPRSAASSIFSIASNLFSGANQNSNSIDTNKQPLDEMARQFIIDMANCRQNKNLRTADDLIASQPMPGVTPESLAAVSQQYRMSPYHLSHIIGSPGTQRRREDSIGSSAEFTPGTSPRSTPIGQEQRCGQSQSSSSFVHWKKEKIRESNEEENTRKRRRSELQSYSPMCGAAGNSMSECHHCWEKVRCSVIHRLIETVDTVSQTVSPQVPLDDLDRRCQVIQQCVTTMDAVKRLRFFSSHSPSLDHDHGDLEERQGQQHSNSAHLTDHIPLSNYSH